MVHQYKLNGYNIVLDTCSGSVHVVDEVAYDIIALYPEKTPEEIVSAILAQYGGRPDVNEEEVRACADALKEYFAKPSAPKVNTGKPSTHEGGTGDPLRDAINEYL